MGRTPDRFPGRREEEAILFDDRTADGDPTDEREMRYVGGSWRMKDSVGVFDPRTGGAPGLTEAAHKILRQLIHFIDNGPAEGFASGAYRETKPDTDPFPTSIIWYDDNTKAKKLVEKLLTYTGVVPTTIQWKMYDVDGSTVLATVTDAITYSGVFELNRTRTIA